MAFQSGKHLFHTSQVAQDFGRLLLQYIDLTPPKKTLIHSEDYRDLKFLQRISAAGLFGTLMSSSGLAYAMVLTWPVEHCLMFAFQMVGVPLALHAYLRTRLGLDKLNFST